MKAFKFIYENTSKRCSLHSKLRKMITFIIFHTFKKLAVQNNSTVSILYYEVK